MKFRSIFLTLALFCQPALADNRPVNHDADASYYLENSTPNKKAFFKFIGNVTVGSVTGRFKADTAFTVRCTDKNVNIEFVDKSLSELLPTSDSTGTMGLLEIQNANVRGLILRNRFVVSGTPRLDNDLDGFLASISQPDFDFQFTIYDIGRNADLEPTKSRSRHFEFNNLRDIHGNLFETGVLQSNLTKMFRLCQQLMTLHDKK